MKIYISQGSAETQLRCGGVSSKHFITNFPQNVSLKNFEYRSIFGEDMDKNCGLLFGPPGSRRTITATVKHN